MIRHLGLGCRERASVSIGREPTEKGKEEEKSKELVEEDVFRYLMKSGLAYLLFVGIESRLYV